MERAEAMRILDPETRSEALEPCRLDCELMRAKMEEACRVAAEAMRESEQLRNQLILRNDELLKLREQVPKWVSVEERLPEDCDYVFARVFEDGKRDACFGWYYRRYKCWYVLTASRVRRDVTVTHWMPLPMPPEVEA